MNWKEHFYVFEFVKYLFGNYTLARFKAPKVTDGQSSPYTFTFQIVRN
jgi:hypothetical protein